VSNEKVKIGIALAAGLCIGGGIGYVVADRKIRGKAEEEIASVQDLYSRLRSEDAAQAREDWSAAPFDQSEEEDSDAYSEESLAEEVIKLGYVNYNSVGQSNRTDPNHIPPTEQPSGEEDEVDQDLREEGDYVRNIRVVNPNRDADPDDVTQWDRDPHRPYVITEDEYRIDRPDFSKTSITYYRGDDTLADENDRFVSDLDGTIGEDNLQFFGLASRDERLLHIRNERVEADFEVALNDGQYSREVLGFGIEESMVRESKKGPKKMRHRE